MKLFPTLALALLLALIGSFGCSPRISLLGGGQGEPLKEYTLEGEGKDKVLIVPVRGVISASPREGILGARDGLLQDIVAQLDKAREDEHVKAVLLKIESPGGTTVASDILLHEIDRYRERSKAHVASMLMGLAASGGYYTAIGGERIYAHPATITGSVGTIFIRPQVRGLMDKLGVEADVTKSGKYKDMSSPFRQPSEDERRMVQSMIDEFNGRFLDLVSKRRSITGERLATVATARVFSAEQALDVGLVDRICYLDEALADLKKLSGLPADAKVVVYRRREHPNDTPYNSLSAASLDESSGPGPKSLVSLGLSDVLPVPSTGFYYLWAPEYETW